MKDVNVTISTRAGVVAGTVVVLALAGTVGWAYKEMSDMRRDLYAVREDYYGLNDSDESADKKVAYELVSQKVQTMRVPDYNKYYEDEPPYVNKRIRVVELKVTNNLDYVYSYYDGSLGAKGADGLIRSSVSVHDDDNLNQGSTAYGFQLAPGGSAKVFVYFEDDGQEIVSLYDTEFSQEIQLN